MDENNIYKNDNLNQAPTTSAQNDVPTTPAPTADAQIPAQPVASEVDADNMAEIAKRIEAEKQAAQAPRQEYSYTDSQNSFVNPGTNPYPRQEQPAELVYNTDGKSGNYTCNYTQPAAQPKKSNALRWCALAVAAAFTVTFMAFCGFFIADKLGYIGSYTQQDEEPAQSGFQMDIPSSSGSASAASDIATENVATSVKQALTINQIAEKCKPSAVGIMVESETSYFGRKFVSEGVGSGFILSEDGYVATNNHVVEGATKITVVLSDGTEYEATLVGADSVTDIAVVKIEATGLPVMERGNSDDLKVGDLAVAIGTPANIELAGTVTDGIISAVNRKIDITDSYGRTIKTMNLIQTNATINPGNSGGPLINSLGQVIGINTLKLTSEYEGIGFAIPINGAIKIMNQLISDGKVSDRSDGLVTGNASIGIQCSDITEDEAEYYGIPQGVLVIQINKNGSAAEAGLRRGDIIIKFNGKTVETTDEINEHKSKFNPGDEVTLTVFRDGDGELDITFKLDMQTE